MGSPKIVIAGTGRAGTTLLVQVLTDLGFDTGYKVGVQANPEARAGLERDILAPDAPRVVKSPRLSTELRPLVESGQVVVEHVIIPVRDLDIAAASRVRAADYGKSLNAPGGLYWGVKRATRQRDAIASVLAELVVTVTLLDIPHTLLAFPRFANDAEYCFAKLGHLDPTLTEADFVRVLGDRYRADHVHETPLSAAEQSRMRLQEPIAQVRRLWRAARRKLSSR